VTYQELADQLRYPDDPAMQELYVQTFEFNPACTLEIGWHLFGENYERGEFLVRMREQLRRYRIAETSDLPDHLRHLLLLIALADHHEAAELAGQFVLPALGKIREALHDNAYEALIAAIEAKLEADYPDAPRRPVQFPIFQEAGCE
jgi:nitrate reductase delta subunit